MNQNPLSQSILSLSPGVHVGAVRQRRGRVQVVLQRKEPIVITQPLQAARRSPHAASLCVSDFAFRFYFWRFGVWGFGFGVLDFGFECLGFRVYGWGVWVWGLRVWVRGVGLKV